MPEIVGFFGKLFNLGLWIESFRSLVFSRRPRGGASAATKFGAQKFVVLNILVVACNITYRGESPAPPVNSLVATGISGIAVVIALIFLFTLRLKKHRDISFALNVVVSHFMLTACLLLILTLIGIADIFDGWSARWLTFTENSELYLALMSAAFAVFCSALISGAVTWNTWQLSKGGPPLNLFAVAGRGVAVTAFTSIVLFAYAMQPVRDVQIQ